MYLTKDKWPDIILYPSCPSRPSFSSIFYQHHNYNNLISHIPTWQNWCILTQLIALLSVKTQALSAVVVLCFLTTDSLGSLNFCFEFIKVLN